jgi:hypothetical protein
LEYIQIAKKSFKAGNKCKTLAMNQIIMGLDIMGLILKMKKMASTVKAERDAESAEERTAKVEPLARWRQSGGGLECA